MRKPSLALVLLLLCAACAPESADRSDAGTNDDGGTSADGGEVSDGGSGATVTFADVDGIFENRCVNCHMAFGPDSFLDLSSPDKAYAQLVNVVATGPDCNVARHVRVVPGDASKSLLYRKVAGTEDCGGRMPAPFERLPQPPPIPADEQQMIYDWIQAGAPR